MSSVCPALLDTPLPADLLAVRAMIFDVDGTLAGADHQITPLTSRALAQLAGVGITPVVATGRSLRSAELALATTGLTGYVVGINGGAVRDTTTGEVVRARPVDPAEVRLVSGRARELGFVTGCFTAEEILVEWRSGADEILSATNDGATVRVCPLTEVDPDQVLKLMLYAPTDLMRTAGATLRAEFGRLEQSLPTFLELNAVDATKWGALQFVLQRLGVPPEDVAGVGDGENDISWLSSIGWPIAMGNALPAVHAVARAQIGHHDDEAVGDLVERIVAARASRGGSSPGLD